MLFIMVLICLFLCRSVSLLFPSLVLCLCPNLHPPSLPLAIFLHLELSLFCLFSLPRPSVNLAKTPSLSYLSFPSGLSISPRSTCSCFTPPLLFPFLVLVLFRSRCLSISPSALLQPVSLCPLPIPRSSFPFAASHYLSAS